MEEQRLDAELDGREQRREVDARVGARARRHERMLRQHAAHHARDCPARERQRERPVEAVRAEREDAAIPEKERLHKERRAHREARAPRAEEQREQHAAHGVPRRAARQRQIEHHR